MDEEEFADYAKEFGLESSDPDQYFHEGIGMSPSPEVEPGFYHDQSYGGEGHFTDDIEYSSPPPIKMSGYHHHSSINQGYYEDEDEIAQYEDDEESPFAFNSANRNVLCQPSYSARPAQTISQMRPTLPPNNNAYIQRHHSIKPSQNQAPITSYRNFQSQIIHGTQPTHIGHTARTASSSQLSQRPSPRHNPNPYKPLGPETTGNTHDTSQRGSNPRNAHGIRLRPTSELPDMYRGMFKFGVFNAVQSECFDNIMHSDANMVVSAPTGSGKTVLFELAIIHMLMHSAGQRAKCIYVAPTKALCSEKHRDWENKFQGLGIKCCELTGDTVHFGKSAWGDARDATVIVTTGEKWDSLTRNWEDHGQILSQIQLFLVDEVHILNESRGSTLEVVVARMRSRGNAVRFLVVSATVPNIQDVAQWIGHGVSEGPAIVKEFGEEFRPCKLSRFVYGTQRRKEQNDFQFNRSLDYRLYSILQQHAINKPVLIFCPTRRAVVQTAEHLMKEYEKETEQKKPLPWVRPRRIEQTFHDKKLEKLVVCGIGVHHAGMTLDDRRATETLFLNGTLRVVVATSTLAVGVNLPAHTVVIKGVKIFQNNTTQEYSDLDIMQMIGRAGRPQFDTEGVAIILCEQDLETKYKALVQGRSLLESCLHLNLTEHLNSEIGLRTITDVDSAQEWLRRSFLFQRIRTNPRHYASKVKVKEVGGKEDGGVGGEKNWQERMDEMVLQSIERLKENELVEKGEDGSLMSTQFGDIMSKYYVRQSTMALILKIPERATLREMLETLSSAEEFSDIKIRSGEKSIYNKLREHYDIRFKVKRVEKSMDKIVLIIQAILGGINLNDAEYKNGDNQPTLEALSIFRHAPRLARAMVEIAIIKKSGAQVKHGLELLRCLYAKTWEDRPNVLRQIEQIGEKSIKVLAQYGINSISNLRNQDTLRIEQLLNRKPPFGHEVLASLTQFPQYALQITELNVFPSEDGERPVEVEIEVQCGLLTNDSTPGAAQAAAAAAKRKRMAGMRGGVDMTTVLSVDSDLGFVDFRRIPTKLLKETKTFTLSVELTKPSQTVSVIIAPEQMAGVAITQTYKPKISHNQYPTMDTRPKSSLEAELEGLEDDPSFWENINLSDDDNGVVGEDKDVPMIDLTRESEPPTKKTFKPAPTNTSKPSTTRCQGVSSPAQKKKPTSASNSNNNSQNEKLMTSQLGGLPRMLANGKFECNHACKDKTKCRHLCCHEGLDKPPPWTKRRLEAAFGGNTDEDNSNCKPSKSGKANSMNSDAKHKSDDNWTQNSGNNKKNNNTSANMQQIHPEDVFKKSNTKKPDSRLEQLERLHKGTNVPERLPVVSEEGGRIKVGSDGPLRHRVSNVKDDDINGDGSRHRDRDHGVGGKETSTKKKPKPKPNFDLEFSDITHHAGVFDVDADIVPEELNETGSEDGLPEASDLIASASVSTRTGVPAARSAAGASSLKARSSKFNPATVSKANAPRKDTPSGKLTTSSSSLRQHYKPAPVPAAVPTAFKTGSGSGSGSGSRSGSSTRYSDPEMDSIIGKVELSIPDSPQVSPPEILPDIGSPVSVVVPFDLKPARLHAAADVGMSIQERKSDKRQRCMVSPHLAPVSNVDESPGIIPPLTKTRTPIVAFSSSSSSSSTAVGLTSNVVSTPASAFTVGDGDDLRLGGGPSSRKRVKLSGDGFTEVGGEREKRSKFNTAVEARTTKKTTMAYSRAGVPATSTAAAPPVLGGASGTNTSPLFLHGSSSTGSSPPPLPFLPASSSTITESTTRPVGSKRYVNICEEEDVGMEEEDDFLAEFEKWVNSGAVVVVGKQQE